MKKAKTGFLGKVLIAALSLAATAGISLIVGQLTRLLHSAATSAIDGVKNIITK